MEEIWKPAKYIFKDGAVLDLTGILEVSNKERMKYLHFYKRNEEKIVDYSKCTWNCNYLTISITKNKKRYTSLYFHRMVLSSFCPDSETYECINHIDENSHNNRLENLEWCTQKENMNAGTVKNRLKKINTNGKCSIPVLQFSLDGEFIKEWVSISEAKRQLGKINISACCKGRKKRAGGYIWKYKEVV